MSERILCGAPISEDKEVFEEHIKSLLNQGYPMDYIGIDNSPVALDKPTGFNFVEWRRCPSMGEYKQNRLRWGYSRLKQVARYREEIRLYALQGGYDYLFMVDSDLILASDTLSLLLNEKKDFIAGLFWTKFRPHRRHIWANVWEMENNNYIPPGKDLINRLKAGGIHQVPITGACSLISRRGLSLINYRPLRRLYSDDMSLALSAKKSGLPLYIHAGVRIEHRRRR